MEWRTHRQYLGLLRSTLCGQLGCAFDSPSMSGDDDLFRRIHVRRLTDLALRGFCADMSDLLQFHTQDRSHGTDSDRDRLLHILATITHRAHRVGKTYRACGHVRRVLTQTVPCHEI